MYFLLFLRLVRGGWDSNPQTIGDIRLSAASFNLALKLFGVFFSEFSVQDLPSCGPRHLRCRDEIH